MQLLRTALSLALLATSALAQSTSLTYPPPGSQLTQGSDITVQVYMGDFPENIDNVAVVIGLMPCPGGTCSPPNQSMGNILYQGPYTPASGQYYANYTVQVPQSVPAGAASLNVINFYMVGAEYAPIVDYLNEDVTVTA